MKLRWRVAGAVSLLLLAMGVLTIASIDRVVTQVSQQQAAERGLAVARAVAAGVADSILERKPLSTQAVINGLRQSTPGIRYIYVTTLDGSVLSTFRGGFPVQLLATNPLPEGVSERTERVQTSEGPVLDVGVVVLPGIRSQVHVGFAEDAIAQMVNQATLWITLLTLLGVLAGTALSYLLGRWISRPIEALSRLAERLGQGELDLEIPLTRGDEVGRLGQAFNAMAANLRLKFAQLSGVYEVTKATSGPLDVETVLGRALDSILSTLDVEAASVSLLDPGGSIAISRAAGDSHRFRPMRRKAEDLLRGLGRDLGPEDGDDPGLEANDRSNGASTGATPPHQGMGQVGGSRADRCQAIPIEAHGELLGALVVHLGQSGGPDKPSFERMGLLEAFARQIGVAVTNARLWETLRRREQTRAELLQQTITAQEEERQRIARELHDETLQSLSASLFGIKAAEASLHQAAPPAHIEDSLSQVKGRLTGTIREVQRVIYDLRPILLDELGLVAAINSIADQRLRTQGIEADVQVVGHSRRLDPHQEVAVFRIVQEALQNIVRHAEAHSAVIAIEFRPDSLFIQVADDGIGFDPSLVPSEPSTGSGLGLLGMRERAALLGGTLSIDSAPGEGTTLVLTVPLPQPTSEPLGTSQGSAF